MSAQINDGGQAFPTAAAYGTYSSTGAVQGMTLRDYFAAKAMQGVIAQACGTALGSDPKYAADYAYAAADAMLRAREVHP